MFPTFFLVEARRLAVERELDADRAELAREAALFRLAHESGEPNVLRRSGARLALAASRASLRLAETLDECVAEGGGARSGASPVG